jgi:hypothetical protein
VTSQAHGADYNAGALSEQRRAPHRAAPASDANAPIPLSLAT